MACRFRARRTRAAFRTEQHAKTTPRLAGNLQKLGLHAKLRGEPYIFSFRSSICALLALGKVEFVLLRMFESGVFVDSHLVAMRLQKYSAHLIGLSRSDLATLN